MNYQARFSFGLGADPWSGHHQPTADATRAELLVRAAVDAQAMVAIVGPRGCGKSHAVRRALRQRDLPVVEPIRLDREKLHLGDIQRAIVRDLSDETPRSSGEARSAQVRRILGTATRRAVLLIDDAHVLHPQTVRGLKRLRELSFSGRPGSLLGVILIGQADPSRSTPEVALRSDRTRFAGLTAEEVRRAVTAAINADRERLDTDALRLIEGCDRARNWLDLQALVDDCLERAAGRGADTVTAEHASAVISREAPQAAQGGAHSAGRGVDAVLGRRPKAAVAA